MEATEKDHTQVAVAVTLTKTGEDGQTTTVEMSIAGGPTKVPVLKGELGVDPALSLWLTDKHGKKKPLADHETHNVKEGDHYEVIVRGGVS